jgi:ATP-binding cassette, subfamily B, bacterial
MKANSPQGLGGEVRLLLKRAGQVWRLVPRRHQWALGGAALVMAVTSLCNTAIPLLLGRLVDRVRTGTDEHLSHETLFAAAAWTLGTIGVLYLVREVLNVLRRSLVEDTCTRVSRTMTVRVIAHMMQADLAVLHHERVGALNGRIFRSVDGFIRFLRLSFLDFFPAIVTGLFALAAVLTKQPLLGLAMAGVIPTAVYLTVRQLRSQKGVRLELMRACEEINGALVERLGGVESIRAADMHDQEMLHIRGACERKRRLEIGHHFKMSLFGCAKALNEGFFHVVVLGTAVYLAITRPDVVSFGDVLTFSILFLSVMTPLNEIHRVLDEGHEASLSVGDLLEMLAEPADASYQVAEPRPPQPRLGAPLVAFEKVELEYATPEGGRRRALDGIDLSIRCGETVGVAGKSGSGKSTWLKVLLRLAHPTGGSVMLGGVPLENVTRAEIGKLIGYVSQSPYVFEGTIAQNIAYGNPDATPEEVRRAAELAHLHDEILLMPGGYDAAVAERGTNLSGGQRQRLALARIMLRQPPLLILDEATSALDNISERHVQQALEMKRPDRTTILVAHRLTTLLGADRIVVFDEGRIVEVGTYEELVQRGGVFAELVMSAQKASPEEAGQMARAG